MNSSTHARSGRQTALAILAASLVLGQAALADETKPYGKKQFQAVLHDADIYGVDDIEAGRYGIGIDRLSARTDRQPHSTRVPALIDLCAAYTMVGELEKAEDACDAAVESGWYSGHAFNNRGTYHIATGNYEAAVRDFQAAVDGRGAERIARTNLEFAQERLVAQRQSAESIPVVAHATIK
jgi:Flp pilus assembly protein TadD